jgi:multiple sugar transport system permease protein
VPVSILIALFIAVLLNNKMRGMKFFETLYFLPYITNVIAIGLAFRFIFHSNYGVLNIVMNAFGIDPIVWLNDPTYALPALMIFGIWGGLAFKIVVFLAGLQGIDKQYYQAAKIDSASAWTTFRKITLPLLSPMIAYITVISLIGSFKVYVEVVGLYGARPGPANSAMTIVYYVYERFYGSQEPTIAAAASVIMFGMILIMTFLQLAVNKRRVHY